ncbi:cell envelope integrity protein TolA [Planctobacterium marinum]|uniref:cell envelope integrity protein TolA n=1 Tax=Planctobacterium marinum TaxID=1631968 RepID=UPI001E589D3A|nr:cell envelope integrity protein TolA [Planctobacterium marinum]MCC2605010.1 hypothetical protein [Planctobacterium marinum]
MHSISIHHIPSDANEPDFTGLDGDIAYGDNQQHPVFDIGQVEFADANLPIDVHQTIDEQNSPPPRLTLSQQKRTLFSSLVLHSIFCAIILYFSAMQAPVILQPAPPVIPIQATLYYPPLPAALPAEPEIEETETAVETPVESTQELRQEPIARTEITDVPEQAIAQNEPEVDTQPSPATPENLPPKNALNHSEPNSLQRLNQALSSHLGQIAEQEMQAMSNDAVRNRDQTFYQQQTQGYNLVEEDPNKRPTKNIDCSGTTGKTVGILSGLLGGTLRCTEKPDFQRYIDSRLNKEKQD